MYIQQNKYTRSQQLKGIIINMFFNLFLLNGEIMCIYA